MLCMAVVPTQLKDGRLYIPVDKEAKRRKRMEPNTDPTVVKPLAKSKNLRQRAGEQTVIDTTKGELDQISQLSQIARMHENLLGKKVMDRPVKVVFMDGSCMWQEVEITLREKYFCLALSISMEPAIALRTAGYDGLETADQVFEQADVLRYFSYLAESRLDDSYLTPETIRSMMVANHNAVSKGSISAAAGMIVRQQLKDLAHTKGMLVVEQDSEAKTGFPGFHSGPSIK